MRFIARFAMRGPNQAILAAAILMLASLLVGPLVIFAGAVVSLVTLRHGPAEGLKVVKDRRRAPRGWRTLPNP